MYSIAEVQIPDRFSRNKGESIAIHIDDFKEFCADFRHFIAKEDNLFVAIDSAFRTMERRNTYMELRDRREALQATLREIEDEIAGFKSLYADEDPI